MVSLSSSTPRSLSAKLLSFWLAPSMYWCMGLFLPRSMTLHFPLLNFMRFLFSPFLQPVEVPVDARTSIWCISHSSQFCIICQADKGALCASFCVIMEDVEQRWPLYWPLGFITSEVRCNADRIRSRLVFQWQIAFWGFMWAFQLESLGNSTSRKLKIVL